MRNRVTPAEGPDSTLESWEGEEKDHYSGPGQCSPEALDYGLWGSTCTKPGARENRGSEIICSEKQLLKEPLRLYIINFNAMH